jgi:hypothetical protein
MKGEKKKKGGRKRGSVSGEEEGTSSVLDLVRELTLGPVLVDLEPEVVPIVKLRGGDDEGAGEDGGKEGDEPGESEHPQGLVGRGGVGGVEQLRDAVHVREELDDGQCGGSDDGDLGRIKRKNGSLVKEREGGAGAGATDALTTRWGTTEARLKMAR